MRSGAVVSMPRTGAEANAARVAVVAALSATTMLFASLASAYLVRRSFEDWRPTPASWPFGLLALGIAASGAIEVAARSSGGARRRAFGALAATSGLYLLAALVVIASIVVGDGGLTRPHDAFIALLLGVHLLHAMLGGAFASQLLLRKEEAAPSENALFLARLVTHFLTALLAGILFLLFVLR